MIDKTTGHGVGDTLADTLAELNERQSEARSKAREPLNACGVTLGGHLLELAERFAHSFSRKWEAGRARTGRDGELRWTAGRPLDACDVEEISAIYHAHFVGAFARCGLVPANKRELYRNRGNALPFRALLAWHRAFRGASRQVRSYLWGHGAEACTIEPLATLHEIRSLQRLFGQGDSVALDNWETEASEATAETLADGAKRDHFSPIDRKRLRRQLRHARWCLRAFWMVGTSRKWRAGFVADNALLVAAASVTRGNGLQALADVGLLNASGTASGDALRQAVSRLRMRLASGDLLLTDQPERVAAAFAAFLGVRRGGTAARRLVGEVLPGVAGRASICDDVRAERAEWRVALGDWQAAIGARVASVEREARRNAPLPAVALPSARFSVLADAELALAGRQRADAITAAAQGRATARLAAAAGRAGKTWIATPFAGRQTKAPSETFYRSALRNGGFVWRTSPHVLNAQDRAARLRWLRRLADGVAAA